MCPLAASAVARGSTPRTAIALPKGTLATVLLGVLRLFTRFFTMKVDVESVARLAEEYAPHSTVPGEVYRLAVGVDARGAPRLAVVTLR